jgi:ABC-type multidrug transport system ATPase subunit
VTFGAYGAGVTFGDATALDGVTVEVEPGSVVAVVGGDGAGKSTLLRAMAGELRLTSGRVVIPPAEQIGFLPASAGSWAALTVEQNMDFAGGVYGLAGARLAERRTTLLRSAGLEEAADRAASALSGGMRRKLGFCMAMQHEPALLVLDEPSTGVDPVSRVDLWRLVANAAADGAAVLMSTTYLDEAERSSHLVVLEGGEVLVQGDLDTVLAAAGGVVTRNGSPVRKAWSWRRGPEVHEYWPDGGEDPVGQQVHPDLEDVVIALSLMRRHAKDPVR